VKEPRAGRFSWPEGWAPVEDSVAASEETPEVWARLTYVPPASDPKVAVD
jgi:hypothetical protein